MNGPNPATGAHPPALSGVLAQARACASASGASLVAELAALASCTTEEIANVSETELGIPYFSLHVLRAVTPEFSQIAFTDCVNRAIYPLPLTQGGYFVMPDP